MDMTIEATKIYMKEITVFLENTLSDYYYNLLFTDMNELSIEERLFLIDRIKDIKEMIFQEILDTYNNFLRSKNEKEIALKSNNQDRKITVESIKHNIKVTEMVIITFSIIVPNAAPFILIINVPKLGLDYLLKNKNTKMIDIQRQIIEEYDRLHKEFFQLTDTLRTDYHRSKKELAELKKRTQAGEDVTEELLRMINPETIGLKKAPLMIPIAPEDTEEPIQYTKK